MSNHRSQKIISSMGVCLGIYKSRELHKIYNERFILRKPVLSLCVPCEAVEICEAKGLELDWIVFNCQADKTQLKVTLDQAKSGEIINFGYGDQYRIPLINFLVVNKMGSVDSSVREMRSKQLDLWGAR
jgi:hypothetical protein